MDIEATGVTRATAGAATICFEKYGEERVYRAFVHPVGGQNDDNKSKKERAVEESQKDIEDIATCLMEPELPDEDVGEKVRACFAEMEESAMEESGGCARAQPGRGRGRGQRRRGKEDDAVFASGEFNSSFGTAGVLRDIFQTNFGAIQDKIQSSTNW
jgi:hypothetical protein